MFRTTTLLLVLGLGLGLAGAAFGGQYSTKDCPRIKLKRQWGGKPATGLDYQVRPIRYVVVHHTVTSDCSGFVECAEILQNMQSYHQNQLNYHDICYNFLIGNDGVVYEGTGWGVTGSHTYGYNANGTGIAFIGNYVEKLPPQAALDAAKSLLACGVKQGELSEDYHLLAASQVSDTKSPGLTLYNEIQEWPHWLSNP
ncbi:peptidoglycan-recognition protein SA [Scaptodrosophila lebanonensis]|uniref:Peptidoglycan-recognition protein n=1 Tax=Drosophila lebanonensis TaxID=7225 RepID=A0A6J2TY89_DROLE|nr:peptidoglycan-recognition protein SA [Scaptodrosophila lebanonensis]